MRSPQPSIAILLLLVALLLLLLALQLLQLLLPLLQLAMLLSLLKGKCIQPTK